MSIYADRRGGKLNGWFRVEVTVNGARARGRARTYAEAEVLESQLIQQLQTPDLAAVAVYQRAKDAPLTLGDLLQKTRGHLWRGQVSEHTTWKGYVEPMADIIGRDTLLIAITTERVDELLEELIKRGLGPRSINRYLTHLSTLLKWAKRRKMVAAMPDFPWQKEPPGRTRTMTAEEEARIYAWFEARGMHQQADFLRVLSMTGMRKSEAHCLTQKDVRDGYAHLRMTKNGEPAAIALLPRAEAILRRRLPWNFNLRWLGARWIEMRRDLGLEDDDEFVIHALRHTYGTRMVKAKVPINVIQAAMRHRDIKSTLRYAHVRQDVVMDAVRAMGAMMGNGGVDGGVITPVERPVDPEDGNEDPWSLAA